MPTKDEITQEIKSDFTLGELLKRYKKYINSDKVEELFLSVQNEFLPRMKLLEKKSYSNYDKQLLIKSIYRLDRKIKKENKEFSEKEYFKDYKEYFCEFETRYQIREEKKFKLKRKNQLKRIDIFKRYMLSDEKYRRLIKQISKNSMYVDDYIMFDFVFYIQKTLKDKDFIAENDRRFSYEYFCKNKFICFSQVMLNELFIPFGFSLKKSDSIFDKAIGFDELIKSSYISTPEEQTKILNKYKFHPSKIYLYYTFSQNPLLNEKIARNILDNIDQLYTYPYSSDIATIIGVIKGNINKKFPNLSKANKNTNYYIDLYKFEIHKDEIFDDFPYTKLEELGYFISYKKNSSNIKEYFEAINEYWEQLESLKDKIQDFDNFKSYIKNLIDSDYLISHYEEFYFQKIIDNLKINEINFEFGVFLEFLYIKLIILSDEKSEKDEELLNILVAIKKRCGELLNKKSEKKEKLLKKLNKMGNPNV